MELRVETAIAASPERVFAVLSDVASWPRAIRAIEKVDMRDPPPLRVGSRFIETRRLYGRSASEEMTVDEISAPSRLVLTAASHGANYRVEQTVERAEGGSVLAIRFSAKPVTLMAKLMSVLTAFMAGSVRAQLEGDLADLKAYIEAGQPASGIDRSS